MGRGLGKDMSVGRAYQRCWVPRRTCPLTYLTDLGTFCVVWRGRYWDKTVEEDPVSRLLQIRYLR